MTEPTRTNPTFKPGDVVLMKMGGPHMTVEVININKPSVIHCVWFDRDQRLRRDGFDDFALKHVVGMP